jgi:hypothetical protein
MKSRYDTITAKQSIYNSNTRRYLQSSGQSSPTVLIPLEASLQALSSSSVLA